MNKSLGCFPTTQQELLLRASLLEGQEALDSWREWLREGNIDELDNGSYRLLPLLYVNLANLAAVEAPGSDKLKEAYMLTFCENQSLFHKTASALRGLEQAGIETILLKGAALALLYYKDVGLRPMCDLDVLVPTNKASQSIELLSKLGWEPLFKAPHSQAFRNTTSGAHIDLHWHALLELSENDSDDDFWKSAVKAEINGLQVLALNPTDMLFQVCVHGMKWEPVPTFRWVADAAMILRSDQQIDWDRLLQHARRHRLTLPLKEALRYLKELLNAPVPADVLTNLEAAPVTISERLDYSSKICIHSERGPLLTLWAYYSEYLHWAKNHGDSKKVMGFPTFLRHLWGLNNIWQVPFMAAKGFVSRSFNALKKQQS